MGFAALLLFIGVFMGLAVAVIFIFLGFLVIHCLSLKITGKEKLGLVSQILLQWPQGSFDYCQKYFGIDAKKVKILLNVFMLLAALMAWFIIQKTYVEKTQTKHLQD